jgi:hypothetical protein
MEATDSAFSTETGYDAGDLHVRSTEGVSGSDSDVAATVKADTLTSAASGLGRATSSTATAATAPMVISDFGWLLHGTMERRGERGWTTLDKQRWWGSP